MTLQDLVSMYEEVVGEVEDIVWAQKSVTGYFQELSPLPNEALLLGECLDGLPLLLNLHDPTPMSVLMVSKSDTEFLSSVAVAIHSKVSLGEKISFGVITDRPDSWEWADSKPCCVGIYPVYHPSAGEFIWSLASWAHGRSNKEVVILLLDNFSKLQERMDFDELQNLRWLLLHGAARRVWTIAASDKMNDMFKTVFQSLSSKQFTFDDGYQTQFANILESK